MNDLFISVVGGKDSCDSWYKTYTIGSNQNRREVTFKIETKAQGNVLLLSVAKSLRIELVPLTNRLRSYSQHRIKNTGKTSVTFGNVPLWFEVVHSDCEPVLRLSVSREFNLVKHIGDMAVQCILDGFPDCFEGIGCLKRERHIVVDKKVNPVINAPCRIPLAMTDKVKKVLQKMEADGTISKVDKPTKWVNSMVVVEKKNGDPKMCLDPQRMKQGNTKRKTPYSHT